MGKVTGSEALHLYWKLNLIQNLAFEIVVLVLLDFPFSSYCLCKPKKGNWSVTPEITECSYAGHGRNTSRVVVQGMEGTVRKCSFMGMEITTAELIHMTWKEQWQRAVLQVVGQTVTNVVTQGKVMSTYTGHRSNSDGAFTWGVEGTAAKISYTGCLRNRTKISFAEHWRKSSKKPGDMQCGAR